MTIVGVNYRGYPVTEIELGLLVTPGAPEPWLLPGEIESARVGHSAAGTNSLEQE